MCVNIYNIGTKYANLCGETEKEKNDLLEQMNLELGQNHERLRELEETISKLEAEKQEMQFMIDKLKESAVNQNIVNIVDEIKDCHFEILNLQSDRVSLRSNTEFQDSMLFSLSSAKKNQKFNESMGIKKKIEELKNAISFADVDVHAHLARKQSLEQELTEVIHKERMKSSQYSNLEKLANQVKTAYSCLISCLNFPFSHS